MAIIRFEGVEAKLPDGARVLDTCEELGISFGCHDGMCGTCICTVIEGIENLEAPNDKEDDMGLTTGERLACQCVIKSGLVEFSID